MMGSKFTVVSEPNKGCSFSFIINFQIPENHEVITGDEYHNKFEVGGLKKMLNQKADVLKDSQILIVEDNRINQYVVKGFLTLAGVKVSLANNGEEALEQIKMHNFNAILMDVHMPVMDGLEATRQIRENQLFKDLPIIALTAGVTPEERKTCLSSGMNDLVSKPVNSNELIAVLCRWI
jgi:CheY-like chemotaxis protein